MNPYEQPPQPAVDASTLFHSMVHDEPPPEPTVDVSNMFQGPPEILRGCLVISLGILLAPVLGIPAATGGFYGFSVGVGKGNDGVWTIVAIPMLVVIGLAWGALSFIVLYTYSLLRRISIARFVALLLASMAVSGLFWLVIGYVLAKGTGP